MPKFKLYFKSYEIEAENREQVEEFVDFVEHASNVECLWIEEVKDEK